LRRWGGREWDGMRLLLKKRIISKKSVDCVCAYVCVWDWFRFRGLGTVIKVCPDQNQSDSNQLLPHSATKRERERGRVEKEIARVGATNFANKIKTLRNYAFPFLEDFKNNK